MITLGLAGKDPHRIQQPRWWTTGSGWCAFKLVLALATSAVFFCSTQPSSFGIFSAYPGCMVDFDVSLHQDVLQNLWHLWGSDVSEGGVVVDFDAATRRKTYLLQRAYVIWTQNFVQCSLPLSIIQHDLQFVKLCQDNLSRMEKLSTVIAESIEVEDAYLFPPNPHVLEDWMLLWALAVLPARVVPTE